MTHKMRLFGKAALSVFGLCLGGMLYASDPEAAIKASVHDLSDLIRESRNQRSIAWEPMTLQIKETVTRYVEAEPSLSSRQRCLYLNEIRTCLRTLDHISY